MATILVGDDPASATYVRMKGNACKRVGMESLKVVLPQSTTTEELLAVIESLNRSSDVKGILLQHPVPRQINERQCFDRILPEKDVDGVTSIRFGRMALGQPAFGSATPTGIMHLLKHYKIPLEGKEAVVVGRSPILGRPLALMLLRENATVTICHSKTLNLPEVVNRADIVIGAVGTPKFIKGSWIRVGAVVVDAVEYLLPAKELGLPERYNEPWGGRKLPVYVYETDHGIIWGITPEIVRDFARGFERA